jgi:hypothetical protein
LGEDWDRLSPVHVLNTVYERDRREESGGDYNKM